MQNKKRQDLNMSDQATTSVERLRTESLSCRAEQLLCVHLGTSIDGKSENKSHSNP
jgi:hypothetical protein